MRVFSVILPVRVSGLLFSEFLLAFCCFLLATFLFLQAETVNYLLHEQGLLSLLIVAASVVLGIYVNHLYANFRVESRVSLALRLCNVIGIALIVQGVLMYLSSGIGLPRDVMITGSLLLFGILLAWRTFYSEAVLDMLGTQKILFVGWDEVMAEIAERVQAHPEQGFGVIGYLADRKESGGLDVSPLGNCLGSTDDIEHVSARVRPNRIIIGKENRRGTLPVPALLSLSRKGIMVEESSAAYERVCGRVCSRELRPSQIIFRNELRTRPGSLALQSIYTNLLALAGIILTSPLLILCGLAIKLTSRGPIMEHDPRVGQHGIPFTLTKFRCHRLDRGLPSQSLEVSLTLVGRWIVRLHLVNLPRLFNLLRGEVSFVGPRPERPEFVAELSNYFPFYQQRLAVKPGMTGWSQINASTPERSRDALIQLEYDLYYTKHISLALDAYILLHGLRAVLPFAHR